MYFKRSSAKKFAQMSYIIDKNFVSKKDFVLERVYNTNHIIKTLKTKQAFFQKDKKD